jgi:hypothetical protein
MPGVPLSPKPTRPSVYEYAYRKDPGFAAGVFFLWRQAACEQTKSPSLSARALTTAYAINKAQCPLS